MTPTSPPASAPPPDGAPAPAVAWPEFVDLNGHRLTAHVKAEVTLGDPDADTDPTIVEDRATLYAVECLTCRRVPESPRDAGRPVVTDLAVNKRTGEWLACHRPGLDDPDQDALGRLVEHTRATLASRLDSPHGFTPLTYGDRLAVDEAALAAARLLVGFGRSPWEAIEVYRHATEGADTRPETHAHGVPEQSGAPE